MTFAADQPCDTWPHLQQARHRCAGGSAAPRFDFGQSCNLCFRFKQRIGLNGIGQHRGARCRRPGGQGHFADIVQQAGNIGFFHRIKIKLHSDPLGQQGCGQTMPPQPSKGQSLSMTVFRSMPDRP
jgi:hypothetical protein